MKNIDKAVLLNLYCEEKKTAFEIAKIYSCGTSTILRHLRWAGVEIRGISEAKKGRKMSEEGRLKVIKNLRYGESAKGEKNPNWKGGRSVKGRKKDGQYTLLLIDGKYIPEHRYVMQEYLGRKLTRDEQIHHKNGDKTDNQVGNLQIMSITEHAKLHNSDPEFRRRKSETMMGIRADKFWSTKKKNT